MSNSNSRQSLEQTPVEGSRQHQIYEQNRQCSPLLRLPAELRLRIYELIFTVGQISIAHRPLDPRAGARAGFYCRVLPAGRNPWEHSTADMDKEREAHDGTSPLAAGSLTSSSSSSSNKPAGHGTVTLLSRVCRQLYHETTLLPFTLNAWSFVGSRLVERYLREGRMSVGQRRAVRTLYVRERPSASVEKSFGSLEVVYWRGDNGRLRSRRFGSG